METTEWILAKTCPTSAEIVSEMERGDVVYDIGCLGWLLGDVAARRGVTLVGVDRVEPPGRPSHARFAALVKPDIHLPDDSCDLAVAGHIIEHIEDPIGFTRELLRLVKPGGHVWLESPSELSALLRSSDDPEDHSSLNFWDDPTHIRPWTPGALYRLAISCQAVPVAIQRARTGDVPVSRILARKPERVLGRPQTRYVTLKGVDAGVRVAYESVWGKQ